MPRSTAAVPLTRARIVDVAVGLVEGDGLEALSMRRLADALGVWPTAIYYHIPTREALVEAVVDEVVGRIDLPPDDLPPRAWLRELLLRTRAAGLAHPGVGDVLLDEGPVGPHGLAYADRAIARFRALGLDEATTAVAYNLVLSWLAGSVRKTHRYLQRSLERPPRLLALIAGDDLDGLPDLAAIGPHFTAMSRDPEGSFARALDLVLDGVELLAGAARDTGTDPPTGTGSTR